MADLRVRVEMVLHEPTPERAKRWRLRDPSRSLLYRFGEGEERRVLLAAELWADGGGEIGPGDHVQGWLLIRGPVPAGTVEPGAKFTAWYGGDVGYGTVVVAGDGA